MVARTPRSDHSLSYESYESYERCATKGAAVTRPIYQVKADFFKTLGHPARIRILELLREGEQTVGQLIPEVGLEPSHLSQQLGVLRRAGVLETHKVGASVVYSVTDARIFELLAVAKAILTTSLAGTAHLLAELETLDFPDSADQTHARAAEAAGASPQDAVR